MLDQWSAQVKTVYNLRGDPTKLFDRGATTNMFCDTIP